jgi:hypothetical protein
MPISAYGRIKKYKKSGVTAQAIAGRYLFNVACTSFFPLQGTP